MVEFNAEVRHLTTFRLPARVAALARWSRPSDLQALLGDVSLPRPLKVIGGGSNLLFTRRFEGTLLLRDGVPTAEIEGNCLRASANATLDDLCALASEAGLRGPENLSGIPGTLGGAIVQNAGAYGVETGDLLETARLLDLRTGEILTVDPEWLQFSYRFSRLKSESGRYAVLDATLRLRPADTPAVLGYGNLSAAFAADTPTPAEVRRVVLEMRGAKLPDPSLIGSAGSFFRNPEVERAKADEIGAPRFELPSGLVKVPAAWLIDNAGLKGTRIGGAAVWPSQPLVIVNADGKATAADVLALETLIVQTVEKRFSITLIPEVEHI